MPQHNIHSLQALTFNVLIQTACLICLSFEGRFEERKSAYASGILKARTARKTIKHANLFT